ASGLHMGLNCGTLAGGCCMLSSYLSRGGEDDEDAGPYKAMVIKLVDWFNTRFGAVNCSQLVSVDREERLEKCSGFIAETFIKCLEILEENGIDPRS
ncbi:MAG: C-GCAxxG-C-C family protein, partial [Oscillospiraceae bacterium]|nr:C-GCAxxG-C-C family protein [Oscillospiraceae bacterium]